MRKILCVLLALCACVSALAGCSIETGDPFVPSGDGLTWDDGHIGAATDETQAPSMQELTLTYFPEKTMNPYFSTDFTNNALFSLLYQGLFTVDSNYNVEPVLCSRYTISPSMLTYTFYIEENATFSDGSRVRPEDVLASLITARTCQIYSGRFAKVTYIGLNDDGSISMEVNTPFENLPILLDVPILKEEQLNDTRPLGTGPYKLSEVGSNAQLIRRTNWWCSAPDMLITAPIIRLIKAEDLYHIRDEFQFGDLTLVQAEPGSDMYVEYLCDYELWDCENGMFLYLACNRDSYVFSSPELRKALTYAIDRAYLSKEFYRGFASTATLPASPSSPYYNQSLAGQYEYDPAKFAQIIAETGRTGWEVTLIVNEDDTLRKRVADAIAEMLKAGGLTPRVIGYDSENFRYALVATEYDLYLGQTILSPNMDLSPFFAPDGNLSYAGLSDTNVFVLCQQALENHGNYHTLHYTVMEDGLLCPILFRNYAVYATRGLLTELRPARNNVFYYSLGKTMEDAYFETDPG